VVQIVDAAIDRLIPWSGIEARLILCTLRHFTEAQSMETVRLVERFRGSHVVALDLAADEAGFSLDAHVSVYRYARDQGLSRTAHAGEARGPESVWETLRSLQPTRIGHGARSIEDPQLVEHLRRERIHLEICPSANMQIIPSIPAWEHHPIDRLYRAAIALNVNTDSRMLIPTTLTAEYENLERTFGWGSEQLLQTNLMGVDAAFADEAVKDRIRKELRQGFAAIASA
jgi:adenosine deaminase